MARRAATPELARLLDSLDEPTYVVDGERQIVFVNKACAAWLGCEAADLIGRECRYAALAGDDRSPAIADALCPPPAISAERPTTAEIVPPPAGDAAPLARLFEFTSLGGSAVLARALSAEVTARLEEASHRREEESQRLHAQVARLRHEAAVRYAPERLLGESAAMKRVRRQVTLAAKSESALSIVGPAGIGKTHVARTIHALRTAADAPQTAPPLVPLDGPTLNAELLQASIRGLYRATRDAGRGPGTLLIADIDRTPADAQAELAGFLRLVDLPMRLVATSREDLTAAVAANRFRADLAAALTTLVIELPPLSKRAEDIPLLAQVFVEQANKSATRQLGGFTTDALDRLAQYAWPGQTAELAEVVAASCAKAEGPLVTVRDLPQRLLLAADAARYARRPEETIVLDDFLAEIEKELLRRAMQRAKGNKTKAAQLLGVTRPRLYRRLVQWGLEEGPVVFEDAADADEPKS